MIDNLGLYLGDIFQILIIAGAIYLLLCYLHGTRAAQMMIGGFLLIFTLFGLTVLFELDVLYQLLRGVILFLLAASLVVFHPEIRRALSLIGKKTYSKVMNEKLPELPTEDLIQAIFTLAKQKIGTLIAIERLESLDQWCEGGTELDAIVSTELLSSIMTPPVPLHDGGIVIRNKRIYKAHCVFPINNDQETLHMGTRHRAAITLSDEADALVIVVSEERGTVSVAYGGRIYSDINDRSLRRFIKAAFVPKGKRKVFFKEVFGKQESGLLPRFLRWIFTIQPSPAATDEVTDE